MLTEIYIEALLADQVWEAWDADETDDQVAWLAWWLIAGGRFTGPARVWWTPLNVRDNA